MKKLFFLLAAAILLSSCAPGPIGAWNYSVTGTPQGDYAGVMTITKTEAGYSAKLKGDAGEIPFNKFTFVKATKKAEGDFDFSGVNIFLSALMNKDQMNGTMSTDGMEFTFKATRKKD